MPQKLLPQVQGSQIFLKECSGKNAKVEEQPADYSAVHAGGRHTCRAECHEASATERTEEQ